MYLTDGCMSSPHDVESCASNQSLDIAMIISNYNIESEIIICRLQYVDCDWLVSSGDESDVSRKLNE